MPSESAPELELLTPPEVAELLCVAPETISQWRFRRTGPPFIRVGNRFVRYVRADVDAWLAKHRVPTS